MKTMIELKSPKEAENQRRSHFVRYDQIAAFRTASPAMREKGFQTLVRLVTGDQVLTSSDIFELIKAVEEAESYVEHN